MRILITGVGGFVGRNLFEYINKEGNSILGIDKSPRYNDFKEDILLIDEDLNHIRGFEHYLTDVDIVYHLAASADIRRSGRDPWWDFDDNVKTTVNLLEYMRRNDVPEIKFVSSSAVYGVQDKTLNEHAEFRPINLYGASKCACESYIQAYKDLYGFKITIFRPAQIIGDYEHRGVIVDFYHKLKKDPDHLEILGNGQQTKSYFHVSDCIDALVNLEGDVFNLANENSINVEGLAETMLDELNLNPEITYTGGDRGWIGDTPFYYLSIVKALDKGWRPKYSCEDAIRKTVRWLNDNYSNTDKKRPGKSKKTV